MAKMNQQQFCGVIEQYQKLVFTVCYQLVKDYQEAENLTQETFLSAYTHLDSCNESSIKPWLARIAANKTKDYLKSAYNRRVQLSEDNREADTILLENAPDKMYMAREGEAVIREKIYALKEPYLHVSVQYFLEERSVDEIAQSLNRPKKTVQTQLTRAKRMLQKAIAEEGGIL